MVAVVHVSKLLAVTLCSHFEINKAYLTTIFTWFKVYMCM